MCVCAYVCVCVRARGPRAGSAHFAFVVLCAFPAKMERIPKIVAAFHSLFCIPDAHISSESFAHEGAKMKAKNKKRRKRE